MKLNLAKGSFDDGKGLSVAGIKYVVEHNFENRSIKSIIKREYSISSRFLSKLKQEDLIRLNGKPAKNWYTPKAGDVIELVMPKESSYFTPYSGIEINAVYEDEHLLVIDKPAGIVVHPTHGYEENTIAHALIHYMDTVGEEFKIRFINRLDMDTTGLLMIAKNQFIQNAVVSEMKRGNVEKRYFAVVHGLPCNREGIIDAPIKAVEGEPRRQVMEGGKPSITEYKVVGVSDELNVSFLDVRLHTGRTHQIRVHLKHIGCPILGDELYGDKESADRQLLHSRYLRFTHPVSKKIVELTANLPDDVASILTHMQMSKQYI